MLIDHSAKVNKVDNDGWTPLLQAAYYADIEVVEVGCVFASFPD